MASTLNIINKSKFFNQPLSDMNIVFVPSDDSYLSDKLFDQDFSRDNVFEPFFKLKEALNYQGYKVSTYDTQVKSIDLIVVMRIDRNIGILINLLANNPFAKVIYLVTEERVICPVHNKSNLQSSLFDLVLTWDDDLIDQKYFFKCNYPNPIRKISTVNSFDNKKLLVMINSYKRAKWGSDGELYSTRNKLVEELSGYKEFSLYGIGWNSFNKIKDTKCYKGPANSKLEILSKYKFSIAFENSCVEMGGISEKIFDSFGAGCVPVYLGAPNITRYIPENCFIDYRNFSSFDDLYKFISEISEYEYAQYINSINSFMSSDSYNSFNSNGFVRDFTSALDYLLRHSESGKKNISSIKIEWFLKYIKNFKSIWSSYRIPVQLLSK